MVRAAMTNFRDALRSHQDAINRLNVFPVPDGDTGTNMMLTVESVVEELEALGPDPSMADVCKAVAHGSLMGARGNSGVILSQILRGVSSTPSRRRRRCDASGVAQGAGRGGVAGPQSGGPPRRGHDSHRRPRRRRGGPSRSGRERGAVPNPRGGAGRGATGARLDADPASRCWPRPGWSTPAGAGYVLLLQALLTAVDGRPAARTAR